VQSLQSYFFLQEPLQKQQFLFHFEPWLDWESLGAILPRTVLSKAPNHLYLCPEAGPNFERAKQTLSLLQSKLHTLITLIIIPEPLNSTEQKEFQLALAQEFNLKPLRFDWACQEFLDKHLQNTQDQMALVTGQPPKLSLLGSLLFAQEIWKDHCHHSQIS